MLMKFKMFCNNCLDGDKYIIYVLLMLLLSLLTYYVDFTIYLSIIVIITTIVLVFGHNNKALLPLLLNIIFLNGNIMTSYQPKLILIIPASIVVGIIIIYFILSIIKSKTKFKLGKSFIPLLALSVINLINLSWNDSITSDIKVYYLLYFAYLLYFLIYLFTLNNFKKIRLKDLSYTILGLGLLIATQVLVTMLPHSIENKTIFNSSFNFGWGISNESGIVTLFCLPFVFMLFINSIKKRKNMMIYNYIQLAIYTVSLIMISVAAIICGSRGTLLIFMVELVFFFPIFLTRLGVKKGFIITLYLLIFGISFGYLLGNIDFTNKLLNQFISDNGRISLYTTSLGNFRRTIYNFFLGNGIAAKIDIHRRIAVYHSTIYQTLSQVGLIGAFFVILLIADKYHPFFRRKNTYSAILIIGFILLDIYGLIDNTYHMYYYMIPLVIMMAIIENIEEENPYLLNLDYADMVDYNKTLDVNGLYNDLNRTPHEMDLLFKNGGDSNE